MPGSPLAGALPIPDLHALRAANLDLVLHLLADVPVVLTPPSARTPWRLAVRDEDISRVDGALRALPRTWTRTTGPAGSRLLRPMYAAGGTILPNVPDLEVELHVLRRSDDVFVAADRGVVSGILAGRWEEASVESLRSLARRSGPPQPTAPIDLVYTWVDGSDPQWATRRDSAWAERGAISHPRSTESSRFVDSQELRYSMRSVLAYANWVRQIILVTDGQVPGWLDVSHPRVRVVGHHELLGASRFNSHALEAALHRIPGLSETYLYLNDDVFFGRIVYPGDFFATERISRFFPSALPIDPGPVSSVDEPIMAAAKNGRDLLMDAVGREVRTRIHHSVHPQLRSVLEELEGRYPEAFQRVRSSSFRSPEDLSVATFLHHWYAWATDRAVAAEPSFLYIDLGSPRALQQMDALQSQRRYDVFCLNQESTTSSSWRGREHLSRFLPQYFPAPGPWELPEA